MKNAVLVLWAVLAVGLVLGGLLRTLFFVVLAAHALEFLVFLPTLRRAPGGLAHHLGQTLVFGVFHYREVQQDLARSSDSGAS